MNKAVLSMQTDEKEEKTIGNTSEKTTESWCGLQHCQATTKSKRCNPFEHLKDVIILDTGSMIPATFNNKEFVANI